MTLTSHKRWLVFGAAGLLVAVLLSTTRAQDDTPNRAKTFEGSSTELYRDPNDPPTRTPLPAAQNRSSTGQYRDPNDSYGLPAKQPAPNTPSAFWANAPAHHSHRAPELGPEFSKAIEALREAEDDKAKSKAQGHLRDLLTEYFGEDMKRREAELKEMEKRLKKLQEQLALRSEKMDEIVDLQMKVLVNQANGLGFFSNGPSSESQPTQKSMFYYSPRPTIIHHEPPSAQALPSDIAAPAPPTAAPTPGAETVEQPVFQKPTPTRSR